MMQYGNMQRDCRCPSPAIQRRRGRISGPLLDRIDIHIEGSAQIGTKRLHEAVQYRTLDRRLW